MGFQRIDGYGSLVSFGFVVILFVVLGLLSSSISWVVGSSCLQLGSYFVSDVVSFYLTVLSGILWVSLLFLSRSLSVFSWFCITVSIFCSVLSYCCVHAVGFWVFYEMSILPLLLLLVLDSPYSERYVASWYLLGYVVLTSLPMLLCLFYLSGIFGTFRMSSWESGMFGVYVLLGVLFITKVPLPPFHVWLPIVHAEASSSVSVCLSGYVMKLGILGVCRFCSIFLPDYIFSSPYMLISLVTSVLFFFSASRELDGKRWLAFLSLSHIIIASVCLCVGGFDVSGVSFVYCFGHGVSAGAIFIFLWGLYDVTGSRNWGILKYGVSSSLVVRCLCVGCLCTAASLPPTPQFFSEVFVVQESGFVSVWFLLGLFGYLFMGGLVPLFLVGCLLTRHYDVLYGTGCLGKFFSCLLFLLMWGFGVFLVV